MSEISELLRDMADRLFRDQVTTELQTAVDGGAWPADLWGALETAGLIGAALPEPHGAGAAKSDAAAVLRVAGWHDAPGPLVETTLAGWMLEAARGLPASPRTVAAVDLPHAPLRLEDAGGGLDRVAWGASADAIVAWGRDGERDCVLRLLPDAANGTAVTDIAGEPVTGFTVDLSAAGMVERLDPQDGLDPEITLAWGAILTCAMLAGSLGRALEDSLAHAQERAQFGRTIGKFQAVQQLLAEAAGEVAAAGAIADAAAEALDGDDRPRLLLMAAAAKARCGEAASRVATISHQVHGAIGYTREHALHRTTRRLWRGRDAYGTDRYWQEKLGTAAIAAGDAGLWPFVTKL